MTRALTILDVQRGRRLAGLALDEAEQQPEGVAVGGDRARARLALPGQPFGEERLQGRGESRSWPGALGVEPGGSQREQLRRGREVPVGGYQVLVPEDSGQARQAGLHIVAVAVPLDQRSHGEAVAVMRNSA